jgi:hypothetical protein
MNDIADPDDEVITCWCGVSGSFDELFSDEPFDDDCGGSGILYCYCGGDQCVCHHHGQEIECPGCGDCAGGDESDWDDVGLED